MNKAMKLFLFALSDNNSENEKKRKEKKTCLFFIQVNKLHTCSGLASFYSFLFFTRPEVLQFPVMHFFTRRVITVCAYYT